MVHVTFVGFMFGYVMGLIGNIYYGSTPLMMEDSTILSILIITYLLFIFKKTDIETAMKILSIVVVADMIFPDIIGSQSVVYVNALERFIIMYMFLLFLVSFTTNRKFSIALNAAIIILVIMVAYFSGNKNLIAMLPMIIFCLSGMGVASIVFENLITRLIKNEIESKNKILELGKYKQNIINLIIHDLKVPVSTIHNLSSNLENGKMMKINHHVGNIKKQLENVLDIDRLEEPEIKLDFTYEDISKIVDNAVRTVEIIASEKNIDIETVYKVQGHLYCDIDLIERTLINLLTNAIKYSRVNGRISMSIEDENDLFIIVIKDNGIGIAPEHLSNIFNKYYTIKSGKSRSRHSTGLGLAFCKLAVEAHKGEITAKSVEGKGSEFEIRIPGFKYSGKTEKSKTIQGHNIVFNLDETNTIKQICTEIKDIPIYKASDIISLSERLDHNNNKSILLWKEQLTDAVYTGDQEYFNEIISPFLTPEQDKSNLNYTQQTWIAKS